MDAGPLASLRPELLGPLLAGQACPSGASASRSASQLKHFVGLKFRLLPERRRPRTHKSPRQQRSKVRNELYDRRKMRVLLGTEGIGEPIGR